MLEQVVDTFHELYERQMTKLEKHYKMAQDQGKDPEEMMETTRLQMHLDAMTIWMEKMPR